MQQLQSSKHTWSYPEGSPISDKGDLALDLIAWGFSSIIELGANPIWSSALDIFNIMMGGCDDTSYNDKEIVAVWEFEGVKHTVQQMMFEARVPPNTIVSIDVEYLTIGPGYMMLSSGIHTYTIHTPGSDGSIDEVIITSTSTSNGSTLSILCPSNYDNMPYVQLRRLVMIGRN